MGNITHEQAVDLIKAVRGIIGALGDIETAIKALVDKKQPPSSKRGGK